MDIRLDGKTALVTGGSRGIGKEIAAALTNAGAKVLITSRTEESCKQASEEIGCEYEPGHVGKDAERVIDACIARLGGVDILVNNAATNPYAGPLIEADVPRWNKTIEVNMTAPLVWSQLVWNKWQKDHTGCSILNLSSVGGLTTNPFLGVYDVTKAALIHMTEQLAAELAPNSRVNAIAPGLVKTDFAKFLWQDGKGEALSEVYPMKRLGTVQDIAAAAVFLVSDQASWVTGQTLVVDGGGLISFPKFL